MKRYLFLALLTIGGCVQNFDPIEYDHLNNTKFYLTKAQVSCADQDQLNLYMSKANDEIIKTAFYSQHIPENTDDTAMMNGLAKLIAESKTSLSMKHSPDFCKFKLKLLLTEIDKVEDVTAKRPRL